MLFGDSKDLEDRVVELLAHKSLSINTLHKELVATGKVSLRAVYKAVNNLINAKVLLKLGKRVKIDHEWASRVIEGLKVATPALLSKGQRVVYTFASIDHLDAFYKTTVLPLEKTTATREIFFYNPHNFWAYLPARKDSEDAYYKHFSSNATGFFTVGGASKADVEFKRKYQSEYFQIDLRDISQLKRTDHITIVGSIIITVRLSKSVSEQIDRLYDTDESIDQFVQKIINIYKKPGKIRFLIEHNAKKADALRKTCARNFYFKRDV